MNVSAKTEYACIAVLELAARYDTDEPVRIREIAEKHGIPSRFLVQILLQLKGVGLVSSTRGASGGYQLVNDPSEVTLRDVMNAMEAGGGGTYTSNALVDTPVSQVLLDTWREVANVQSEMLGAATIADLLEQVRARHENMYYI